MCNDNFSTSNPIDKEVDPVQLTNFSRRRFTLPFVTADETHGDLVTQVIRPFQVYDYVLSDEELENERPFMHGRVQIPPEILVTRPIYPVRTREILSDEEIENERPFMSGRKKVPKDVVAARGQRHLHDVLSDEEYENEHPFVHGRNRISKEVVHNRRFLMITPALSDVELENERPFMHGRKCVNPELEGRRHQRRIIDFFSDGELENLEEITVTKKIVRKRRSQRNKELAEKKRFKTPCQKFNEFRKESLVPAVKSVQKFFRTTTNAAKENVAVAKDVIQSDEFKEITAKLVKKPKPSYDTKEHRKNSDCVAKLLKAKNETASLFNEKRASRARTKSNEPTEE